MEKIGNWERVKNTKSEIVWKNVDSSLEFIISDDKLESLNRWVVGAASPFRYKRIKNPTTKMSAVHGAKASERVKI